MKLTILFLFIFSTTVLKAQLYIAPSEKSDSYMYAKDRLIFVQNEIHLIKNNKNETGASLYLRKGSQLLQGDKPANINTGSGDIAVVQQGTSNAFDYNYWGLPVVGFAGKNQLNDYLYDPLSNTESKKAKLTTGLEGYSDPLSISGRWIYTYSGANYSDWQYVGEHFDLLPGEGFSMKGVNGSNSNLIEGEKINPGSAQMYDFRGLPNDGKIELPVKKDQVLLVGNPYPSSLDLEKFLFENISTTGIAYFWDSKKNGNSHYLSDYEGGYGTYSPGAGIYIPAIFKRYSDESETGEIGESYPRKRMPIAQGFMIIGKNEGVVHFQNSQRMYQKEIEGVSNFKSLEPANPSVIFNIEIDSMYVRQLALSFNNLSTVNEDHGMDARKMDRFSEDISWSISEEPFLINVRPKVDQELIPLKINLKKDTSLKFSAAKFNNFNPDRLFVYDAQDDLYFGITTGYFKMSLPAGDYNDRFFISFIEQLPAEDTTTDSIAPVADLKKLPNILLNTIDIFQNNSLEQLETKVLYNAELKNLKLFDLHGKLILNKNFIAKEKEFNFSTGNLSNAIYIVKVITNDNKELTKKISIRN
ncbi:T9SS type A sorting domain-containing protein [Christiangramia forsetii]|uniref:Secretion system C-terminal sorting domain-containing protein n=2 Tax=Christiangramia forsetii TaxID=411153 RepID=A0M2K8_CHRFK|nr:T9SS type A sorting domain-containing protein [Christiangramia forsetii]GGG38824.1 T9SS C-terminal target domain-containing protein [Christiangramia forsetii]CAL66853.1 conserved hypothetical protein, secreted [Christiangramia forsetii KT0803]